ncbi:ABC transporter permease [Clostridium bornimense]|uniref:ABC transporter permease n=1 Tax=Clostridium bornimense TaxID=1216932 RepID=UPI0020A21A5F|nr:ABC transporter permease [Clostridium bornimense]
MILVERIKEIMQSKELLKNLTSKELKLKYKNSAIGFVWSFFNPLIMMMVYTFAFKVIFKNPDPNYPIFILSGLLPWTTFQTAIMGGTQSIVNNAQLIKKVYFPREIIPLSIVLSSFVNYLITLIILFIGIFIAKIPIGIPLIAFPVVLFLFLIFTTGLTLILSSLNVIYRDVSHFVEVAFMAWIYLTPVIYQMDLIPAKIRPLMYLNPMTLVLNSIRACLYENNFPSVKVVLALAVVAFVFLWIGFKVFNKLQRRFAEEI